MKRIVTALAMASMFIWGALGERAQAVELLISGDFETPGGVGDIPGWVLEEFRTGSDAPINSADLTGGPDVRLFLRAFEGGGPLRPAQGNFDDDNLPAGDVDGADFLTWQRNLGLMGTAEPAQGDADEDLDVDGDDLARWRANFGKKPAFINARLSQVVPAAAGTTYSFQGTSTFEEFYSGAVTTLDAESPFGAIPSPTTSTFKMEFLNSTGGVIGAPAMLDLRTEQQIPGIIIHSPVVAQAPAGTVNVRVTAEALNMAWNGNLSTLGAIQSAFFNDFSLTTTSNPDTDLLTNGNLDQGPPDALDFWNQVEQPQDFVPFDEILRTPIAPFSNHTPGGSRGVWLSNFFGAAMARGWSDEPVDGTISQTVQAVGNATYTFSGWTKFEANYSGGVDTLAGGGDLPAGTASPTLTQIKLEFLDVNSQVIDSAVIDVEAARKALGGGIANDNQWRQHVLAAMSPSNTRFARLTASMIDGVFNTDPGQSAFFDDFSLDGPAASVGAVPEPSSLVGLALGALMLGRRRSRERS